MKKIGLAIVLIAVFGMIGYFIFGNSTPNDESLLHRYDLQDKNIYEIVAYFEARTDEPDDLNIGITGSKLLISDRMGSLELDLPEDQFYLSFAPYINQTHPCANHNLITCRGELKLQDIEVVIINLDTNVTIVNKTITTENNGFAGIWLPKNIEASISISMGNLNASTIIETKTTSDTCLTTLQLS